MSTVDRNGAMRSVPISLDEFVAPASTALVLWDMQKGLAGKAINRIQLEDAARRLIEAARLANVPVIWSRHVLPPLHLTSGPFLLFLMKKQGVDHPSKLSPTMQEGMEETGFLDGFAPRPDDVVLDKSQPSLFVDTPLDLRLKTLGIRTLVLAGATTDIGIEFTARHAAALGYYSVIVEDATGAYSRRAHERSIEFFRSWITPVAQAEGVCSIWRRAPG